MACSTCGTYMVSGARYCHQCGNAVVMYGLPQPAYGPMVRPQYGRRVAGVCAAVALRYGWDVSLLRVLVVVFTLLGCGTLGVVYLIAWVVMPNGPYLLPYPMTGAQPGQAPVGGGGQPVA